MFGIKIPDYETQNEWIEAAFLPIVMEANPAKAYRNLRELVRINAVPDQTEELQEALYRLETEGTSEEKVFGELEEGVRKAAFSMEKRGGSLTYIPLDNTTGRDVEIAKYSVHPRC